MNAAMATIRTIVALGGGGFSDPSDDGRLDQYILGLARRPRPKVCFVSTASYDSPEYIAEFFRVFEGYDCEPSVLRIMNPWKPDRVEALDEQDVIYVGGGYTSDMLEAWRRRGVDDRLRAAWQRGAVLCGISAGSMCWFDSGVTSSLDVAELCPIHGCLGLIPASHCPHYDDADRRDSYRRMVAAGDLAAGFAADGGVALHFDGTRLVEVVTNDVDRAAYRVTRTPQGYHEERLPARMLARRPTVVV